MGVKKLEKSVSKNTKIIETSAPEIIKQKKIKKKKVQEATSPEPEMKKNKIKVKTKETEKRKKNKIKLLNTSLESELDESEERTVLKDKKVQKKVKRKSLDNQDKKCKSTEAEEKESKHAEKPKAPEKRRQEKTKAKKRPLDSSDDEEDLPSRVIKKEVKAENVPSLPTSLFSLSGETVSAAMQEDESSDEEELNKGEVKKRRKVSRAQKQRDAKQLEEQLREAERSRLTKDTIGPQTEDDYRELLLTNKACSATWIQYISFLLAAGEHERARATARRGLSIIPFEEQKERANLWVVLLRLEVMYGMDDSAAETALAEACSNADDYTILTNMADIYQENEMFDKAEEIHRRITKKYYAELDAWVRIGQFYFSTGRFDDARTALSKALRVLKKKEGVDVTCRFAQLEYKYGDVDKAKSMFESLLANFPKRIDVWNVYVDLLIKANDTEQARNVLSRMCCLQMRLVKKMSLFSKWRQFEQTHGNASTQEAAKRTIDELLLKEEAALDQ